MAATNPLDVAARAAQGFEVLECLKCAETIQKALLAEGHHGQRLEIRGKSGRDFIICLSLDGGLQTITHTGKHVAIRVGDQVFDNLHPKGLAFDSWLRDFDAIGGVELSSTVGF